MAGGSESYPGLTKEREARLRDLLAFVQSVVLGRQRRKITIDVFEDGEFGVSLDQFMRDPRGPIPGVRTTQPTDATIELVR